jgi:hypothetical protein
MPNWGRGYVDGIKKKGVTVKGRDKEEANEPRVIQSPRSLIEMDSQPIVL